MDQIRQLEETASTSGPFGLPSGSGARRQGIRPARDQSVDLDRPGVRRKWTDDINGSWLVVALLEQSPRVICERTLRGYGDSVRVERIPRRSAQLRFESCR